MSLNSQALDMRRRLYPGDHPNTAQSLLNLGENCRALGDIEKGDEFVAEAEDMKERLILRTQMSSDKNRSMSNKFGVPVPKPMIRPRRLQHGSRGIVLSPSSTIADQSDDARRAAARLESLLGVELRLSDHALGRHFYSSGSTSERIEDLATAFADPSTDAVLFSMGGATAIDLVERVDYDALSANPKIVAGMSDSSTLLNAIVARTGMVTFLWFRDARLCSSRHAVHNGLD